MLTHRSLQILAEIQVVFPLLCWNEEDEALWNDDPQEFVRKGYDVLEDLYSPRTAASNLLREIVGGKRGRERLDRLLAFIDQILSVRFAWMYATSSV